MQSSRWQLLKAFFRGQPHVVQVCVWDADRATTPLHIYRDAGIRLGMWVMSSGGVAIVSRIYAKGEVDVMLVDEDGNNKVEMRYLLNTLRQCRLEEIPPARRPDKDSGFRKGYY
jgi:hypothetical protein